MRRCLLDFLKQAASPFTPMQICETPPNPLNKTWQWSVKTATKAAPVWYLLSLSHNTLNCHRCDVSSLLNRRTSSCWFLCFQDLLWLCVPWTCEMMGTLVNGRRGGRSPSLLMAALIACVLLLGFNYWVSNSRNVELQVCLPILELLTHWL